MDATQVQLSQSIERTAPEIIDRYRRNDNWRLFQKEWIYRNFPPSGRSWLDFGCGAGEITTQLAMLWASRVVGVDVTPGLLEMTRRRAELDGVSDRVQVICGDISSLEPQPVDIVLSFAVLHHMPDHLPEVIPVIRRWLNPGGIFISAEPVSYIGWLEWLRQHSGVPHDDLDPGERKLSEADLACIEHRFARSTREHFHCFARLSRVLPMADRWFRRMDAFFLKLPGTRPFAGHVIQVCQVD
jgi:SAM-dependent methyltransferase